MEIVKLLIVIISNPFARICVPKKIEDVNSKVFNLIKGMNE